MNEELVTANVVISYVLNNKYIIQVIIIVMFGIKVRLVYNNKCNQHFYSIEPELYHWKISFKKELDCTIVY